MELLYSLTIATIILFILSFISNILNLFSIPLFIFGGIFLQPILKDNLNIISLSAQIGLLLLLFYIGFEISPIRYLKNIKKVIYDGSVDLILTFIIPLIIFILINKDIKFALFLSALLYVTSSAINLKIIVDSKFAIYSFAEKAINISLFQDLFISFLIIILPLLFVEFKSSSLFLKTSNIFIFAIFLNIVYLLLKYTRDIINRSSDETIVLFSFAVMLLSSYISSKLINSEAMGAFIAGSIIKATGYRIDMKRTFTPIKDIFSPFFFLYFGLNININFAFGQWHIIILIVLLSIISKYLVSYLLYSQKSSAIFKNLLFGLLTIRGEFSIVLASISFNYLDENAFSLLSIISTMVIFVNIIIGLFFLKLNEKNLRLRNL